jgi:hypothetical protein
MTDKKVIPGKNKLRVISLQPIENQELNFEESYLVEVGTVNINQLQNTLKSPIFFTGNGQISVYCIEYGKRKTGKTKNEKRKAIIMHLQWESIKKLEKIKVGSFIACACGEAELFPYLGNEKKIAPLRSSTGVIAAYNALVFTLYPCYYHQES